MYKYNTVMHMYAYGECISLIAIVTNVISPDFPGSIGSSVKVPTVHEQPGSTRLIKRLLSPVLLMVKAIDNESPTL